MAFFYTRRAIQQSCVINNNVGYRVDYVMYIHFSIKLYNVHICLYWCLNVLKKEKKEEMLTSV